MLDLRVPPFHFYLEDVIAAVGAVTFANDVGV